MKALTTQYRGTILRDARAVTVDGRALPARLDLQRHSPDGFAWGYGGSGPTQLALAICCDFLGDDARAFGIYQAFKWRIVAQLPRLEAWALTGQQVFDAVTVLEREARGRS